MIIGNASSPRLIARFGLKRNLVFSLSLLGAGHLIAFFLSFVVNVYMFSAFEGLYKGFGIGEWRQGGGGLLLVVVVGVVVVVVVVVVL